MILLLAFGSLAVAAQAPRFPSEANRVTVDAVVTDGDGLPVAGLTRDDFVVKENGVVQPVIEFEAVDVSQPRTDPPLDEAPAVATNEAAEGPGRSFLLVIDDLNLSPDSGEFVKTSLAKFLEAHVRDGDTVTIAPTAGGAWWSGRMPDARDDVLAALKAVRGRRVPDLRQERMSDHEAMLIEVKRDREAIAHVSERYALYGLIVGPSSDSDMSRDPLDLGQGHALVLANATDVYTRARQRNRHTLKSLERAMNALAGGRGRRAVILASDGFVQDGGLREFERVRESARRSNAALYYLDARG
jgi:VWFA-related protein